MQPLDAITNRSAQDGTIVNSSLSDTDLKAAAAAACDVMITATLCYVLWDSRSNGIKRSVAPHPDGECLFLRGAPLGPRRLSTE